MGSDITLSLGLIELLKEEISASIVSYLTYAFAVAIAIIIIYNIFSFMLKIVELWGRHRRKMIELKFQNSLHDEIKSAFEEITKFEVTRETAKRQIDLYVSIIMTCENNMNLGNTRIHDGDKNQTFKKEISEHKKYIQEMSSYPNLNFISPSTL